MLEELEVRDLGPIRSARLSPSAGMTAITGETGAGKSMLLNAMRLISGDTAKAAAVAAGAKSAWAQAVFAVSEGSKAWQIAYDAGALDDEGLESDGEDVGGELFLSRSVPTSGRSRAVLNGHSVPRTLLNELSGELVTIHGQADQLRIASSARQREFLDGVAADDAELREYADAWQSLKSLDERLVKTVGRQASDRQRVDYLRDSIARIERVEPKPGEYAELKERRSRIENAAEISTGVKGALSALDASQMDDQADGMGAIPAVNSAIQSLRSIKAEGGFNQIADRLDSLNTELSDVVYELGRELDFEDDADALDGLNLRIHELDELMGKWGPTIEDVLVWHDKAVYEVEDLDDSPQKIDELKAEREQAFHAALMAATALSDKREQAAQRLSSMVTKELSSLAMTGARFDIVVRSRADEQPKGSNGQPQAGHAGRDFATWPLDANGCDDVEFLFTPFAGSPRLAMGKSASGGELSRLMLALELSAAVMRADVAGQPEGSDPGMTFIFDEVDAGVGGKAAVELGRRLATLARDAQVIVVTHLPQVASWADAQFVVSKGKATSGDVEVETTVTEVAGQDRVHEIARMLSGSQSATSLNHAKELLDSSRL
jgi:DNA repair protein RecN (Recombination protein N)